MISKNSYQILLFSFAVLMVLLRPYTAYRISMRSDIASDPVKINSLLQRLVKKKDDHHISMADHTEVIVPLKSSVPLITFLVLLLISAVSALAGSTKQQAEIS